MSGNRGSYLKRMHSQEPVQGSGKSRNRNSMNSMISDHVNAFVNTLRSMPEYQEYLIQKERISKEPELFREAERIRRENFILQTTVPREELTERMLRFAEVEGENCCRKGIHEYLEAEAALSRLMQEVLHSIMKGLEF